MIKVDNLKALLETKFYELTAKYDLHQCELIIEDDYDCIAYNYDNTYKQYYKTPKQMYLAIVGDVYDLHHTFAKAIYFEKNNQLRYAIFIPEYNLYKMLYECKVERPYKIDDDEIIEYIVTALEHEIGHIQHYTELFEQYGVEDGNRIFHEHDDIDMQEYLEYASQFDSEEYEDYTDYDIQKLCIQKYGSMYAEREANTRAGIDTDRFYELELKVHIGLTPEHNLL